MEINGRLVKSKFNALSILLYSGASSYIILGKYMEILQDKITNTVLWIKQGVDFNADYTIELKIVLPELYETKKIDL